MAKLFIERRYGQVPNDLLNSCSISLKAKGMYAWLQSKPDNWSFSVERISLQTLDQKDAIRSALHELENAGYLRRKAIKQADGTWGGYDYVLADCPLTENPSTVHPLTENPDTLSKKESSNKDIVIKIPSGFEDFWKEYPRKTARAVAEKAWKKLKPSPQLIEEVMVGLQKYKNSEQWLRDGGRYIPHPATFINQRRWEDEVREEAPSFAVFK